MRLCQFVSFVVVDGGGRVADMNVLRRSVVLSVFVTLMASFGASRAGAQPMTQGTPSQPPPHAGEVLTTQSGSVELAEPTPFAAPQSLAAPSGQAQTRDGPDNRKRVLIALNPLGVIISRYSLQVEVLPLAHHAVTLNPFLTSGAAFDDSFLGSEAFTGYGAELGYRYYSNARGPKGFFAGSSLLLSSYTLRSASSVSPGSFASFGGALDVGGQTVIGPGFTLGAGFGLQYTTDGGRTTSGKPLTGAAALIAGGGVRPRFLFSAGFAF